MIGPELVAVRSGRTILRIVMMMGGQRGVVSIYVGARTYEGVPAVLYHDQPLPSWRAMEHRTRRAKEGDTRSSQLSLCHWLAIERRDEKYETGISGAYVL